jgi:hypothetical protein
VVAIRWYLRYNLSYRDVEELLVERGIEVDHGRCCIKRSSRSLRARLPARSNLSAQRIYMIATKASYGSPDPATDGGLAARLEPRDGRSAAPSARDVLMQQCLEPEETAPGYDRNPTPPPQPVTAMRISRDVHDVVAHSCMRSSISPIRLRRCGAGTGIRTPSRA